MFISRACLNSPEMKDPSLSNSTPMDLLNATDSSPCTCIDQAQPAFPPLWSTLLLLSLAPMLPSSSSPFPLAPDAICLSHSGNSSALSYLVRSPLSHSVDPSHRSFSTCTNLKCTCNLRFRLLHLNFQYMVICTQNRHTHVSCNAVPL